MSEAFSSLRTGHGTDPLAQFCLVNMISPLRMVARRGIHVRSLLAYCKIDRRSLPILHMAETVARQAGVVIAWEAAQSLVDTCQGRPSAYSGKERIQVHVIDFLCYWDVCRISRRMRLDRSDHDDLVVIRGDGEIRIAGVVRRSVQVIQAGRVHVTCYAQFRIGHVGKVHLPVSEPRTGSISDGIDQEDLPSLVQGNRKRLPGHC